MAGAGSFTYPVATAYDSVDGDLSANITITGNVDPNTKGQYTCTYTVSDSAGNTATATLFVDIVNDVDYLSGTYIGTDSIYNPPPSFVSVFIDYVTIDSFVNGKIWVTKFGNYMNGRYALIVTHDTVNLPAPAPVILCGSPANYFQFTNSTPGYGGHINGTGGSGTTISIDYHGIATSPAYDYNSRLLYIRQ